MPDGGEMDKTGNEIITRTDPEALFNALLPALFRLEPGGQVRIFLSGRGKINMKL
jgi:hypothetical protein